MRQRACKSLLATCVERHVRDTIADVLYLTLLKVAILVDDMIDTGKTLTLAAKSLHENGAKAIYCLITHGMGQSASRRCSS